MNFRIRYAVALALMGAPLLASASSTEQNAIASQTLEQREMRVNATTRTLSQLRSAVTSYYLEKGGWPTTLSQITSGSEPFYNGSLSTPLGKFSSSVTGNAFLLKFKAKNNSEVTHAMVQTVANQSASSYTNGTFEFVVPVPQTSTIVDNMLNRMDDADGHNTMLTDLHMGGNDIKDIENLFATDVDIATKTTIENLDATNITTENLVSLDAKATNANIDKAFFDNFTINNDATTNSFNINELVVRDLANGEEVNTNALTMNAITVKDAYALEIIGDTAELNNAQFNARVSTTSFTVDQELTAESIKTDKIKGYKSVPIKLTSSSSFNSLDLNDTLNVNENLHVKQGANLLDTSMQSVRVAGTLNSDSIQVEKNLNVQEDLTLSNGARIYGNLTARDIFATDVNFSGLVTAKQGVDISGSLNVGQRIVQNGQLIATETKLYDNGQSLASKYLGLNATAKDSEKVDGYDSTDIAQRGLANTFGGTQTFNSQVSVAGNVYVNGRLVVDSSGYLYDGGQAVRNIYATKSNAKSKYSEWDTDIAQLKSSLNNQYDQLNSYYASVDSTLSSAESKANQQASALIPFNSTYASLVLDNDDVESNIRTLSSDRETQNATLVSAISKINSGPSYQSRSCTITTTYTEKSVNSGTFTKSVSDGCGSKSKATSKTSQYGSLN